MTRFPGIVAGRLELLRRSTDYGAVRTRLRAEASVRHEPSLRGAPFWRRLRVRLMIEREAQSALRRMYPPGALYAACPSR